MFSVTAAALLGAFKQGIVTSVLSIKSEAGQQAGLTNPLLWVQKAAKWLKLKTKKTPCPCGNTK